MVAIESTMLPLGTEAPAFTLPDTEGAMVARADFAGRPLLVMFICNHCPFVIHVRAELAKLGHDYQQSELAMVAINSNDVAAYPADSPEKMRSERAAAGYAFPYLFDASQAVAKAYRAACTPDFYLFDRAHRLAYRGQLDSSRPNNGIPVTGADLRRSLDAVLAGEPVPERQMASIGCNIKWRPGNAPEYFGS